MKRKRSVTPPLRSRRQEEEDPKRRSARAKPINYAEDSPDPKVNGSPSPKGRRNLRSNDTSHNSSKRMSSPILSKNRNGNKTESDDLESDGSDHKRNSSINVRFSPSAKTSSPTKWEARSRRQAAEKASQKLKNGYDSESSRVYTPYPRRSRRSPHGGRPKGSRDASEADHESSSEDEDNTTSTRRRGSKPNKMSEDEKPRRKVVREDQFVRRSTRLITPKRSRDDDDDETCSSSSQGDSLEDDEPSHSEGGRPHRKRRPVQRLTYEKPTRSSHRRRHKSGLRNLDQYSTDDEFRGGEIRSSRRRKYNIRKTRKSRLRPTNKRDSSPSSSSASSSSEEERFIKRKTKRMDIERAKMRPLNMTREDMKVSIIRDRRKVGTSCADVQPMEIDTSTTFESVGGSPEHIKCLKEVVVLPLLYPELFSKFNITPPRGVLFHGPPGTGKTLLARALASECSNEARKVAFYMRKGADVLSKWVGESERQLRLLFEQAYLTRPSIIFFDEFDGIAPVRNSRQDQIHSTIVSTLLALIDGLDSRGEVIVIGATNRIENIDPAFRRPGRFDRELRFQLPTRDGRLDILKVHTKMWKPPVTEELLNTLADKTIGYSGADIKGLCAEAVLRALRRKYPQVYATSLKLGINVDNVSIIEEDFKSAMAFMVPSTHRVHDQVQAPLPRNMRCLIGNTVDSICQKIDLVFNPDLCFRPRLLISGSSGQGLATFIGPAILHHLEKWPCHLLDLQKIFYPEHIFQTLHEARRVMPSVLYIPQLQDLLSQDETRRPFMSLVASLPSTAPLLILAVLELDSQEERDEVSTCLDKLFAAKERVEVDQPAREQRRAFFEPVFKSVAEVPVKDEEAEAEAVIEPLPIVPFPQWRELSEIEEQKLRRNEKAKLRELRIFLRDVWQKINNQAKFRIFQQPVNTEELDDYLNYVDNPMDLVTMLQKLDDNEYETAQSFLDDIDLIASNAKAYNADKTIETNRIIVHQASALADFAYALIKADMDTDFEEQCKEIVERRKRLTEKLAAPEAPQFFNQENPSEGTKTVKKKTKRKTKSPWARGKLPSKPKKTIHESESSGEELSEDNNSDLEKSFEKSVPVEQSKLDGTMKMLLDRTKNHSVEDLERLYVKLMSIVSRHLKEMNRRKVQQEIHAEVENLNL